jgi:tRNA-guanine family transglycosylase
MAGEILSSQLNSLHNLYFYHGLMKRCREMIRNDLSDFGTSSPTP